MALTKLIRERREAELEDIMKNFRVEEDRTSLLSFLERAGFEQNVKNQIQGLDTWENGEKVFILYSPQRTFRFEQVDPSQYICSFKYGNNQEGEEVVNGAREVLSSGLNFPSETEYRSAICQLFEGVKEGQPFEIFKGALKFTYTWAPFSLMGYDIFIVERAEFFNLDIHQSFLLSMSFVAPLAFEFISFNRDRSEKKNLKRIKERYSSLRRDARNLKLGKDALSDLLKEVEKKEVPLLSYSALGASVS